MNYFSQLLIRFGVLRPRSVPMSRVVMLGLDAAGKTTLLYKLVNSWEEVISTIPTIGFHVETIKFRDLEMICWDVGGCDKIRPLWRHYFINSEALIFVIDANDKERFPEAKSELEMFLNENFVPLSIPILILANKQDLSGACNVEHVRAAFGINTMDVYARRKVHVQGTSFAGDNVGVVEAFCWLEAAMKEAKKSTSVLRNSVDREVIKSIVERDVSKEVAFHDNRARNHVREEWLQRVTEGETQQAEKDQSTMQFTCNDSVVVDVGGNHDCSKLSVLLLKLQQCCLEKWDHYTHVHIAWGLLYIHGISAGFEKIDLLIALYIDHVRGSSNPKSSPMKSFHRSLTRFWAHMIAYQMLGTPYKPGSGFHSYSENKSDAADTAATTAFKDFLFNSRDGFDICNGRLYSKFYSNERLFSSLARTSLVSTDILELPPLDV